MTSSPTSNFVISSMWGALGVPSAKIPISIATFAWYILPAKVGYFIAAVLAITPHTQSLRVALCPVVVLLALRAAASVDMTLGGNIYLNVDLAVLMFCFACRTVDWALAEKPLVRRHSTNSAPSTIMDALDLCYNLRGIGWNWSRGLHIPPETRPANRLAFVFSSLLSTVKYIFMYGALQRAINSFARMEAGSNIPTIFDHTLPFTLRYLRSTIIATLEAFTMYSVMQLIYTALTVPVVLFIRQDPALWPPAFDAPWCSTSLNDFWSRRWHQWYRTSFVATGGYPLSLVLGRVGMVLGTFVSSGIFHHVTLIALDCWTEWRRMIIAFGMMGVGVIAERMFYKWTGNKVGGVVGWIWTMTWLVAWGHVLSEGYARGGLLFLPNAADDSMPVRIPVEQLVIGFDRWLHTI